MKTRTDPNLIAPCGMNCAICAAYLAAQNDLKTKGIKMPNCPGCRPRNKHCAYLKGHCSKLSIKEVTYCFQCAGFPCNKLKTIDKRYRSRYRMSMIENLNAIKANGIEKFLRNQEETWKCKTCGKLVSCHNGLCFNCDLPRLRNKKNKYRWDEE